MFIKKYYLKSLTQRTQFNIHVQIKTIDKSLTRGVFRHNQVCCYHTQVRVKGCRTGWNYILVVKLNIKLVVPKIVYSKLKIFEHKKYNNHHQQIRE